MTFWLFASDGAVYLLIPFVLQMKSNGPSERKTRLHTTCPVEKKRALS